MLAWVTLKVLMFHSLSRQALIATTHRVVISALRLEALLKKLLQTGDTEKHRKEFQVEVERTIIFITSLLLLNLFKLLLS